MACVERGWGGRTVSVVPNSQTFSSFPSCLRSTDKSVFALFLLFEPTRNTSKMKHRLKGMRTGMDCCVTKSDTGWGTVPNDNQRMLQLIIQGRLQSTRAKTSTERNVHLLVASASLAVERARELRKQVPTCSVISAHSQQMLQVFEHISNEIAVRQCRQRSISIFLSREIQSPGLHEYIQGSVGEIQPCIHLCISHAHRENKRMREKK